MKLRKKEDFAKSSFNENSMDRTLSMTINNELLTFTKNIINLFNKISDLRLIIMLLNKNFTELIDFLKDKKVKLNRKCFRNDILSL